MSIFDDLYGASKEAIEAAKKPFIRKAYKRLFDSAYGETMTRLFQAQERVDAERKKFDKCDMNIIVDQKLKIDRCKNICVLIKEEYKEVFGQEMKVDEE